MTHFAILPNEAQAYGWWLAHPEIRTGPPEPVPDSPAGLWKVPTSKAVTVKPLKTSQVTAPPSPGSSIEAARLHAGDRPRITARVISAAEKRRAKEQQAAEEEARRRNQPTFDITGA